ncbi:Cotton fiber protein [Melia azedarach]|uniref:Cotton fiber protein n=1 Tax=Melia azedarach TaxID=155640 RepID=A0ACC1WVM1_MELAZ|nr:Cotton fiber protein [Melia azedarach]
MAKPLPYGPSYLDEIPVKAYKSKEYPQRARGFSFFVCVCSVFVYISIFYVFNLSPSTFLNNNKFWFFISNTLILIIAADYGAFSSSGGNKHDVYEEYVMHSQARSVSSFVSQYPGIAKENTTVAKEEVEDLPEIKKEVIVAEKQKNPENKIEIVTSRESEKPKDIFQEKKMNMESEKKDDNIKARPYRRSQSDKPKRVVIDDESKKRNILRRSETEKKVQEGGAVSSSQEENEFSAMSNEELNRRVEEFIQRFNRQIRLQRAGKFHEI